MFHRSPLRFVPPDLPLPHQSASAVCASGLSACPCCSDQAIPAQVLALLPGGMAFVNLDGAVEEISVELVECAPGDVVLVHAGVAIARSGG